MQYSKETLIMLLDKQLESMKQNGVSFDDHDVFMESVDKLKQYDPRLSRKYERKFYRI